MNIMSLDTPRRTSILQAFLSGIGISLFAFPVLLLRIFDYTIIATVTQFAAPLFWFIAWIVYGYGVLLAILYIVGYWRVYQWLVSIPLLLLCAFISTFYFLPFDDWSIKIDFSLKHRALVEMVTQTTEQFSGQEQADELIYLPFGYRYLSSGGGEIIVMKENEKRISVMFYVWRGVLDTSSGLFVYTSDDTLPSTYIGYDIYEERFRESWYFVIWR